MSDVVIRVEKLSKQYRIGGKQEPYNTFRETLMGTLATPLHRFSRNGRTRTKETFWALKDVSFEVKQGEVLGIIGRNGAGKSTLLKILSRITEPTEGTVYIKGRVGALLEVGTGFHAELTGRENIYLNGAILGMKRDEIAQKFDEIVAFSELEKFIDTPVKRYSSGMYMRLAFAVAAHLEPEILVVDEVLSVGDAMFQKKCLGKMSEVAGEGRTVLFVSHNMVAITSLCSRAVILNQGNIVAVDSAKSAIQIYANLNSVSATDLSENISRSGSGAVRFNSIHIEDNNGNLINQVVSGQSLRIILNYRNNTDNTLKHVLLYLYLYAPGGYKLAVLSTHFQDGKDLTLLPGDGCIECVLPRLSLTTGRYTFSLWCGPHLTVYTDCYDQIYDALTLEVIEGDYYGTGFGSGFEDNTLSAVYIDHSFRFKDLHQGDIGT